MGNKITFVFEFTIRYNFHNCTKNQPVTDLTLLVACWSDFDVLRSLHCDRKTITSFQQRFNILNNIFDRSWIGWT